MSSKPYRKANLGLLGLRISTLLSQSKSTYRWWRIWGGLPVFSWVCAAIYYHREEFRQAKDYYLKGLEKNKTHRAARYARLDLAYCYYRLEDFKSALKELGLVVRDKDPIKDGFSLQAKILTSLGKHKQAARVLAKAIRVFPEDNYLLARYAHALYFHSVEKGKASVAHNAIEQHKKTADINDVCYRALETASAHFELVYGEREKGEKILVRALASGDAPFEAYLLRGEQLLEQGRTEIAREQFKRAMTIVPLDARPLSFLAESYLLEEDQNLEWAESLALRSAALSCWQDERVLKILMLCAQINEDADKQLLYTNRYYELAIARELDVYDIRKTTIEVQRLQQFKVS